MHLCDRYTPATLSTARIQIASNAAALSSNLSCTTRDREVVQVQVQPNSLRKQPVSSADASSHRARSCGTGSAFLADFGLPDHQFEDRKCTSKEMFCKHRRAKAVDRGISSALASGWPLCLSKVHGRARLLTSSHLPIRFQQPRRSFRGTRTSTPEQAFPPAPVLLPPCSAVVNDIF